MQFMGLPLCTGKCWKVGGRFRFIPVAIESAIVVNVSQIAVLDYIMLLCPNIRSSAPLPKPPLSLFSLSFSITRMSVQNLNSYGERYEILWSIVNKLTVDVKIPLLTKATLSETVLTLAPLPTTFIFVSNNAMVGRL